jgi:hypothetical protein
MYDVQSFGMAGCDAGQYLVVAELRERLSVSKHKSLKCIDLISRN